MDSVFFAQPDKSVRQDFYDPIQPFSGTVKTRKTMNKEKKEPIFEFDFTLIANFFRALDRQGPGGNEQTLRALEFLPWTGSRLRIADIGCGTGRQTEVLARHLDGTITAVDLLPEMIEGLNARMKRTGLSEKVTSVVGSMDELPFSDGELDIIWAEGSIYNIGFERGLAQWRRFLKPGGVIAVTECSWITPVRQPTTAYIRENFPEIDTPAAKVRTLEKTGYIPLAHFILPRHCWTENYFAPVVARIPAFLEEQRHSPAAVRMATLMREEIEHYRNHGTDYGYVFYIGQKPVV